MTRSRTGPALLVAVPLAAAAVALTVWAGPYWFGEARRVVDQHRWPGLRAEVDAAVDAVTLPEGYVPVACPLPDRDDERQRCWRVERLPDVLPDLEDALAAAGATPVDAWTDVLDAEPVAAVAVGTVAGRVLVLVANRELRDQPLAGDMFTGGSSVRLTADVEAP